ncbi:MAG: DUF58 domain-containing protein, partial [Candidatus Latescibacteria bacterium]|nr:DUF58 domain-containing protein [Candidatus Latescibacterota bacterium]
MIPKHVLKKVRQIEIRTRHLVNDVFSGEYHSVFKGRGMEFAEVREYEPGDDIRSIDWNVTARMGRPYIKRFTEERELTVILVVDVSASSNFGTFEQMKGEIVAELCAVLAFSAIKNNDRVGLLIFTDQIEKFIPPKKGRTHILRVIRELLYTQPGQPGTDITQALAKGAGDAGAAIVEGVTVTAVRSENGRVKGVDTTSGVIDCEVLV